eukprot:TRINITY_DN3632_c0_g3_i5.p5 TRINITY_DN3632_c0_g3~~TRINITY_DN3632_c0_g3_i5.p5  ORF type:complete len:100 (+),score=3.43 TRINITY_DN3632_c0_g3_i5:126-425(+)
MAPPAFLGPLSVQQSAPPRFPRRDSSRSAAIYSPRLPPGGWSGSSTPRARAADVTRSTRRTPRPGESACAEQQLPVVRCICRRCLLGGIQRGAAAVVAG